MTEKPLMSDSYNQKGLWWKITISCLLLIGVGAINGLWTQMDYKDWYASLNKPFFSPPPSQVVGMIWTVMYITMGISIGIIWQIRQKSNNAEQAARAKSGIRLFVVQIVVNMIVPIFFFAFHNLYLLLFSVIINLILVIILIKRFNNIHKTTAIILIPYLLWLIYATILDAGLLWLNSFI